MCQPPPQNLSCAPSTSSHQQMASYQSHLSNNLQELELNEQERRKLERKRARNRMAASKCRQRKIERISQLEGEVQQERQRFQALQNSVSSMEKTLSMLQCELQRHKHSGCVLDKSTLNLMSHLSTIMNNNNNNVAVPMDTR
uniref:BZIP domain-containing protein n=1 Tax=Panagrolaimus superbus TaxID=310955 RepID=A0A914Z6X5_9BILA